MRPTGDFFRNREQRRLWEPVAPTADRRLLEQALLGIAYARDSQEILRHACDAAQVLTGADAVAVLQMRRGELVETVSPGGRLECRRLVYRLGSDTTSPAHLAWRTGLRQEKIEWLTPSGAGTDAIAARWAVLVEPLRDEDVTYGLLILMRADSDGRPLPVARSLPAVLGVTTAVALSRADELRLLRSRMSTDPLTGLPSGRAFRRTAAAVVARAAHWQHPVSVLVASLEPAVGPQRDGSPVSDDEILATADRWRGVLRPLDLLARHGGDGFAVLLHEVDPSRAQLVADRLVATSPPQVNALFGAATAKGEPSLDALLDAAQHELFLHRRSTSR